MTFEIGDVVRHKSGGPNMTIESCAEGNCVCIWFTADGVFQRVQFEEHQLVNVPVAAKRVRK